MTSIVIRKPNSQGGLVPVTGRMRFHADAPLRRGEDLVIGKLWPDTLPTFSTWLYSHVDPGKLPFDSEMNAHWAQSRELGERLDRFEANQHEVQKDTIKNTLLTLMSDSTRDHSEAIRYELDKLKAINADCWVVDAAEQYLLDRVKRS